MNLNLFKLSVLIVSIFCCAFNITAQNENKGDRKLVSEITEFRRKLKADLTIKSSEMIGIYGASGSGKSTLWRMISTIETLSSGEIFLRNELAASEKLKKILQPKRGEVL